MVSELVLMALPAWTESYIGIPYEPYGSDFQGADCWGLCRLIYSTEFGIDLPDYQDSYTDRVEQEEVRRIVEAQETPWREVPREQVQVGDLVLLRIPDGSDRFFHIGVMLSRREFLNCRNTTGSCIENLDSPFWSNKVSGFYRHARITE